VSQEERARIHESVPYVKVYRYNPKHLYPKLNGYGDNGQRNVGLLAVPRTAPVQLTHYMYTAHVLETNAVNIVPALRTVIYLYGFAKMPFVFSHVEYCDMHFVYGFCKGNARVAVEEYERRFPDRRIPSRGVFSRIH